MHKLAENEHAIIRHLLDNLPLAIFLKDVNDNFKIKLWNHGAENIFGLKSEDVLNKSIHEFWPQKTAQVIYNNDLKVVLTSKVTYINEEVYPTDQGALYLKAKKIPLCFTNENQADYLLCVYEDITDSKKSNDEKRKLLKQLEDAQSIAKIGSWKFNLETQYLEWSKEHYKIFEIESPQPQDQLYQLYRNRIHPDDVHQLDRVIEDAIRHGQDFIYDHRLIFENGRIKYVQGIGKVSFDENKKPILISGTCQDQTVQKEAEFRFEQMAQTIEEVFWMTNAEKTKMLFINSAYEKIWGRSRTELYNHPHVFIESIHPNDRQRIIDALPKQPLGQYNETYRVVSPDGTTRWVRDRAYPIKSHDGQILRYLGIVHDITLEVEAEEALNIERTKSLQNSKLASLGELSASIAHEINNPLAVISATLSLLEKYKNDPQMISEKLEKAIRATDRIIKIVSGLKKFSHMSTDAPFEIKDLSLIVNESLALVDSKLQLHAVSIHPELKPDMFILCNDVEIEQVIVNLINNSIDAIKKYENKWIKIILSSSETDVFLDIIDAGHGLSPEIQKKLFEPFFTTKPIGEGTGLGLSISKGILNNHKAKITIDSTSPNTCFKISFPKVVR